jgi:hypothetical protein
LAVAHFAHDIVDAVALGCQSKDPSHDRRLVLDYGHVARIGRVSALVAPFQPARKARQADGFALVQEPVLLLPNFPNAFGLFLLLIVADGGL